MSQPHDGQRPFFPFGNPFRMILPRSSYASPKLKSILNSFEETLADRFKKLKPKDESEIVSLLWMRYAMQSLSETHTDVKILITDLQFPISDWDGQWMDMYLDNSVKLLDVCIAFISELSRLDQGQLLLQYALNVIGSLSDFSLAEQLKKANSSIRDWIQQINWRSPKLENSCLILQGLARSLCFTKIKNSAKGKILMQAMYGVKLQTIFVCNVFSAAFMSSSKPLVDLQVSDNFPWAESFNDLQTYVNGEIRRRVSCGKPIILRELEAVSDCVEKLHALIGGAASIESESFHKENGVDHEDEVLQNIISKKDKIEIEVLQEFVAKLSESAEKVANGLDLLSKQTGDFFQIVLSGREALLCNLRASDVMQENDIDEHRL